MAGRGVRWALLAFLAWRSIGDALAGDPCAAPIDVNASYGARIAAVACAEHRLWFSPFLDDKGRLASITVAEAENAPLRDGATPGWRRVAEYWKGSGLLWQLPERDGAAACNVPAPVPQQAAACRVFIVDTPWSAAFVSFVMARAGLPGFTLSASHIDFIRDAWRNPESPYRLVDPEREAPSAGDLLCFARSPSVLGYSGLVDFLQRGGEAGLAMHCDIAVAANAGGDERLHLVGGNVLQGVTARVLAVNRKGLLWQLPRRDAFPHCNPGDDSGCSFNRQDWVALLKLKPLPAPATPLSEAPSVATPACCVQCVLPMPPGMQRCPLTGEH